jgi:putative endonuclease
VEARPGLRRGPGVAAQRSGAAGEDEAARYLENAGLQIVARNFKTRLGEVDIVARDGAVTVFVEVKKRQNVSHGTAAEFVSGGKARRVVAAARLYAARHGLTEKPIRFDVIAIDRIDGREQIRHHKGAFDAR